MGGKVGGSGDVVELYSRRAEPMLVLLSNLYSVNKILVDDSRPSSCPAYTIY